MKTAIINIGQIVSGDIQATLTSGNAILMEGENLTKVGQISEIQNSGSVIVITGVGKIKLNLIEHEGRVVAPNELIKSIRKRLK